MTSYDIMGNEKIYYLDKFVGILRPDRIFVCERLKEHFFKKFGGFAVSIQILEKLKKKGCIEIRIRYHKLDGGEDIYRVHPDIFYKEGNRYTHPTREFDHQFVLNLKYFLKVGEIKHSIDNEAKEKQEVLVI